LGVAELGDEGDGQDEGEAGEATEVGRHECLPVGVGGSVGRSTPAD
jgi:hypothetical protein